MATTFTNLIKQASVSSAANGIALAGDCRHNQSDNRITNFTGRVYTDDWRGNFNYAEQADGNVSYNVVAPSESRTQVENLMFAVAADIHTEFDITNE